MGLETLNELITHNLQALRLYARKLTRDEDAAGDLVQETILKLLENAALYEERGNFRGWAMRIMFNTFAGQYRRRKKFGTQFDPEIFLRVAVAPDTMGAGLYRRDIERALAGLSRQERAIIIDYDGYGYTYEEIAARLGIPEGTVRSRLTRARQNMALDNGIAYIPRRKGGRKKMYG